MRHVIMIAVMISLLAAPVASLAGSCNSPRFAHMTRPAGEIRGRLPGFSRASRDLPAVPNYLINTIRLVSAHSLACNR